MGVPIFGAEHEQPVLRLLRSTVIRSYEGGTVIVMADITLEYEHNRDPEKLHEKADRLFRNQDRVESVEWDDDDREASVKGSGFSGRVTIDENRVVCTVELGTMASAFKGPIEQQLRSKLDSIFEDDQG